jgi:hypothetical protein
MARNDSTTPERRSPKDQGCHTRKIKVNQIHYLRKLIVGVEVFRTVLAVSG